MALAQQILTAVFVGLFGLVTGSFLNVCIFRIPAHESVARGRSHCMNCGATIAARDLVPVVSYLVLHGRCRRCGAPISAQYPCVEALNAAAWLVLYFEYGLSADFILFALFTSLLIIIAFIDFAKRIIPNALVVCVLLLGAVSFFCSPFVAWPERLIGFFAASLPLLLAALLSRGGMGAGDVKLMAAGGLLLGWQLTLLSLFAAALFGTVYGIAAAPKKAKALRTMIPFGPFLAAAMFLCILFGKTVIRWYISCFLHI